MHQADMRYAPSVYDTQQGIFQERELSSNSVVFLRNSDSRSGGGARSGIGRDLEGKVSVTGMFFMFSGMVTLIQ